MKRAKRFWEKLTPEQTGHLAAVFVASILGSLGTTAFLTWTTEAGQVVSWVENLALTFAATVIYAVIVSVTFYIFLPASRPALKRILTGRNN